MGDIVVYYPNNTDMSYAYSASICYYHFVGYEIGTRDIKFWILWDMDSSQSKYTEFKSGLPMIISNTTVSIGALDTTGILADGSEVYIDTSAIAYVTSVTLDLSRVNLTLAEAKRLMPSVTSCELHWCSQKYGTSAFRNGALQDEPQQITRANNARNLSITPSDPTSRRASVVAEHVGHLARVESRVAEDAAKATESERSMTLLEGIRTYPKAVGWSILLSTCIIMEGFDIVLINSLFGLPAFQQRFGTRLPDGTYQLSAAWQSGLSNGALVGEIIGLLGIGIIVERIGFRKTMIIALAMVTCFIFLAFFAQNLPMLLVGEILCGLPWGAFQTLTTTYAAEVCPVALRAYLPTYVNLCWVFGQFLSSGVLKGVANQAGPIGYKLPYGLQWIWPVPLIIGISLAPESPWWLVRKGLRDDAKKQLLRLTSKNQADFDLEATVNMMVYTTELERANTTGASYLDCFKGVDRRRTEIVCGVWTFQNLCGASSFTEYSTCFFEQAGLDIFDAFSMLLG